MPPFRFTKNLANETIKLLERVRKCSKTARVRDRAHCVLLSHKGFSVPQLAKIFGVSQRQIYTWLDAWDANHFAGLYDQLGKSSHPLLKLEYASQIKEWIKQFPKQLEKVCQLIWQTCGIFVCKETLKRFIKKHLKFSWKRARQKVNGQPDPEEYEQKKKELEALREQAQNDKIDLYYFDETGISLKSNVPYAWQEKGQTIEINTSSGKRLNIVGFLNPYHDDGFRAYTFDCSIDSDVAIASIDEFCKTLTRNSVLVIDNAPTHTSQAFESKRSEWEKHKLTIFNLPKYSPELNLIEIVWRFIKYEWIEFDAYDCWDNLIEYVEKIIQNYGNKYQINFASLGKCK